MVLALLVIIGISLVGGIVLAMQTSCPGERFWVKTNRVTIIRMKMTITGWASVMIQTMPEIGIRARIAPLRQSLGEQLRLEG